MTKGEKIRLKKAIDYLLDNSKEFPEGSEERIDLEARAGAIEWVLWEFRIDKEPRKKRH